ncbi:DUF4845 domain-containing protein [Chitinibacteraceae bacterium HSL-7]
MRHQQGLSFVGFIIIAMFVGFAVLLFFKVVPVYTEYFAVEKALKAVASEQGSASPSAIREAFDRQATIGYITVVKSSDLIINQGGGKTTVSASYESVVPLFGNASLLFEFNAEGTSGSAE